MCGLIVKLVDSFASLRDLASPRFCCVCGEPLSPEEKNICLECFESLPLTYFWEWWENPAYCRLSERMELHSAASLFLFRSESRFKHIPYSIKYEHSVIFGYRLGYMLGKRLGNSRDFETIDAVVPVPLHKTRQYRRGYNQAAAIARGIAEAMDKPLVEDAVIRRKRTVTQTRLNPQQKAANVSGAFRANGVKVAEMVGSGVRHILIVDDVLTTGATISECARPLSKHFIISVASLAFVD